MKYIFTFFILIFFSCAPVTKNILVKNLNLLSIENDDINLSVHILGTKLDFKSIMIASREFEYSPSGEGKENLNFIFKKRS